MISFGPTCPTGSAVDELRQAFNGMPSVVVKPFELVLKSHGLQWGADRSA